jgi:hypothetical protein
MLKAFPPAAVLLAVLALAGPAAAQDPATSSTPAPVCTGVGESDPGTCASAGDQTIGDGQVITDPAAQVDGPTAPDDGDHPADQPKRGEQHVLGDSASASSDPAPAPAPAAAAHTPASASPPAAATATSPKTLPFTGIDAGPLALMGVLMLGSGLLLRRRLDA